MPVRVVIPPAAIVSPADLVGASADDAAAKRAIMAAQRTIDGPDGWLGRAIGPQTLELSTDCFDDLKLPYPPLIKVDAFTYLDGNGVEQAIDEGDLRWIDRAPWFRGGFSAPRTSGAPDALRLRYRAGYDGVAVADGGTGPVPDEAKQAVILMAQHMLATSSENLFVRSDTVEGIGSLQFTVTDQADALVKRAAENLLQGLRVYA